MIGMQSFGASAPLKELQKKFGFTVEHVVEVARGQLSQEDGDGRGQMNVAVAADHAGYALKQDLIPALRSLGHTVEDLGTHSTDPVDYPDTARDVSRAVLSGAVERGVLICGSGIGASVAANKIRGIRAGLCHDSYSAHQGVEHDDMNVLVLGARVIGPALAEELARIFLEARFTHEQRHERRLGKIKALEDEGIRDAT